MTLNAKNSICLGGGFPGGDCLRWQLHVLGGSCLGASCSYWKLSYVAFVRGGSRPGWQLSGWHSSVVAVVHVAVVRITQTKYLSMSVPSQFKF